MRQQRQRLFVRRLRQLGDAPQPFVEQAVGQRAQATLAEVHQGEGEIVEHVDAGHALGELDGIERHRLAVDQHDVAQVQIAMAAPHGAGPGAARHHLDMRFERIGQRRRQRLGDRLIQPLALFAQLANVGGDRPAIVVRPGKAADRRQSVVIGGDARAQRRHHLGRERAAVGHAVEQALLVEAAHDDQPVDGIVGVLTDLAKAELAVAAAHGCGAEIDLRRQLVIDLDLGRAHRAAPFGRREIHVGELHGALELVAALRVRNTTAPCVSMRRSGARCLVRKSMTSLWSSTTKDGGAVTPGPSGVERAGRPRRVGRGPAILQPVVQAERAILPELDQHGL